jgi:hypothetical protein
MIVTQKLNSPARVALDEPDRNLSLYGTLCVVVACLLVLATMLLPGCSGPSGANSVDVPHARDALKIALDAWKNGESTQSLASSSTPMTVQDFEWDQGAKLIDYQLMDEGKPEAANLRVGVKLTMSGKQGTDKNVEKIASYVVGTSPRLTVFRDIMRRGG